MVSILITARNEKYLGKTIENVLSNARGEIEIIVILDGYLPDPQLHFDERVKFVHYENQIGQRKAINEAAKIAKGKYIMKLDAHCAVDEGFDIKLAKDCEYNWTVIPRMYCLDVENWKPKLNKVTDQMWLRSPTDKKKPFRHNYWDGKCCKEYPEEYRAFKKAEYNKGDICDMMVSVGACFFIHRDRFLELGGLDEEHGSWGQFGIEVALMTWFNGGRHVVNKNTWFAHWFRGDVGFPYHISSKDQHKARRYSRKKWLSEENLPKMVKLVEKFSPLPRWNEYFNPPKVQHSQQYAKTQLKEPLGKIERAVLNNFNRPDSTWIAKGHVFKVEELRNNRLAYAQPKKKYSIKWLTEVFPDAVKRILSGEEIDSDKMKTFEYYKYLVARLHPSANNNGTPSQSGFNHVWGLFYDLIKLCNNIKKDGLKAPLDMYMDGNHPILIRGHRRLEIMYQLGRTYTPVRIWRNEHLGRRFIPTKAWPEKDNTIHGNAVKQFIKHGHKSTDKYWVHNYTPYYDFHMRGRYRDKLKILELGVKDGMSLYLWRDSFPRAKVYGIDINEFKPKYDRIVFTKGDERNTKFLDEFASKNGPFDMIVDDALHRPDPQRLAFNTLWKYVNTDGIYVVEDLHPNYRDKHIKNTAMPTFKENIDKIWTNHEVKEVCFYPNICFIRKA